MDNAAEDVIYIGEKKFERKLDGLILIGEDWTFLSLSSNLQLSFPGFIDTHEKKWIKGSTAFRDANHIWSWKIGTIQDMGVYLCFFNSSARRVNFKHLLRLIYDAFTAAVMKLEIGSKTRRAFTGNITSGFATGSRSWRCKQLVYMEDYEQLGPLFAVELNSNIVSPEYGVTGDFDLQLNCGIEVCFMAMATGQSCLTADIRLHRFFDTINFRRLTECIVHVAYDISVHSSAIVFNRMELVKRIGRPYQEYYAACIGRHGNFYFTPPQGDEIKIVKVYSSVFSDVHRAAAAPFQKAIISETLWKLATGDLLAYADVGNDCLQEHLSLCTNLRRLLGEMEQVEAFGGRIELIKVVDATERFEELNFLNVISQCDNFMTQTKLWDASVHHTIEITSFLQHIRTYVNAACNTVSNTVIACKEAMDGELPMLYSVHQHLDVAAAEAIICTMIYGSALSVKEKRHSNDLCRVMGLTAKRFQDEVDLFPEIRQVEISENEVKFTAPSMLRHIFPKCCSDMSKTFVAIVEKLWENDDADQNWKEIAQFLIDTVRISALTALNMNATGSFGNTEGAPASFRNRRMLSVQGFLVWLSTEGSKSRKHQGLYNIIRIVEERIPLPKMIEWRNLWRDEFERVLIEKNEHIVFAKHHNEVKIVVPFHRLTTRQVWVEYLQRTFESRFLVYGPEYKLPHFVWSNVLKVVEYNDILQENNVQLDDLYKKLHITFL